MLAVVALGVGPAWLGWLLVAWAPLVGLARVATGLHFVSDVLAGWALGFLMGLVTLQVAGAISLL
jgi:undecaprenyl-diphosphatase